MTINTKHEKNTIGLITIGQTPRLDMTPAIRHYCPSGTTIVEKGGLDGKTETDIQKLAPEKKQTTLVSRLENGEKAIISKEKMLPIIQQQVTALNHMKVDFILLACTGKFDSFNSDRPVIYPDYLLNHVVKGLFQQGRIGVVIPLPSQSQDIKEKWSEAGFFATSRFSSPYVFDEEHFSTAISELDKLPLKAIILDCMGYTEEMKQKAQAHTSKPVLLSRNIVFSVMASLF
ncbi:MAG TPA: AroM family protein [Virgibacillus sp.]|nr:AroM family protein [Virgibacillus sp.]